MFCVVWTRVTSVCDVVVTIGDPDVICRGSVSCCDLSWASCLSWWLLLEIYIYIFFWFCLLLCVFFFGCLCLCLFMVFILFLFFPRLQLYGSAEIVQFAPQRGSSFFFLLLSLVFLSPLLLLCRRVSAVTGSECGWDLSCSHLSSCFYEKDFFFFSFFLGFLKFSLPYHACFELVIVWIFLCVLWFWLGI